MKVKRFCNGWNFLLPMTIGLLVFSCIVKNVVAGTNVSGYISSDTTWTQANSPYVATGNVIVRNGVTLTIEPGVTVKFDGDKALQIDGTLIAKGTNDGKITFTKNSNANWGYILFNDSSTDTTYDSDGNYISGSIIEYCVIEYAGGAGLSNKAAIKVDGAHPFINYCIVRNNSASGIYADNLSGSLKITNNTFNNNTTYSGVIACYYGKNIISNNTISNNTASYNGGIFCHDGTNNISNNTISSTSNTGIYTYYGIVTISNNSVSNNSVGIHVGGTTGTISSNIIQNNSVSGISSGSGVTISNNIIANNSAYGVITSAANISNNIICNNFRGIYINNGLATIYKNSIVKNSGTDAAGVMYYYSGGDSTTHRDFKYNTVTSNKSSGTNTSTIYIYPNPFFNYNNVFGNTATYELWNGRSSSSSNLDAKNNWWGTADDSAVQGKIYDWIEDNTKGLVDYYPFETALRTDCPISPPTGLTATSATDQISLSWTPNSESDTKGYKVYWDTDSGYSYANSVDVGSVTSHTITGLVNGKYYVTVTAYDSDYDASSNSSDTIINENQTNGNESWYADETKVTVGSVIATPTPSPRASPTPTSTSQPSPTSLSSPIPRPTPSPFESAYPTPILTLIPTLPPTLVPTPTPINTGVVFGFVVDEDGNLIMGVTVSVIGMGYSDSTTTDESGYYEFSGLAAGNYTLTYTKSGYTTQSQEISIVEGEEYEAETVMMETVQKGSIYGNVVNIKGDPIELVKLKLRHVKTKKMKGTASDADGFFEFKDLDAGTYIIFATKQRYKNTQQTVRLSEGEGKEIEIEMKRTTKRVTEMGDADE